MPQDPHHKPASIPGLSIPLATLVIMAGGYSAPASAQLEEQAGDMVLDQIVVTARKRQESTFEVPATLAVFDRGKITEIGADSLADLAPSIPNFFYSSQRPFATTVTMRGLGAALGNPGVGMYIDGAYQLGTSAFTLPLYDVERVEVLKGPQGTLYGRNSFAGAINYITRAPSETLEADVFVEVGNGDTAKGSVSVAGPVIEGLLSGRITAGLQRRDGFFDFADGTDADFADYDAIAGSLSFTPSADFIARLRYSYLDNSSGSFLYQSVSGINDDSGRLLMNSPFELGPFAGRYQYEGVEQDSVNLNMTYSWDNTDLVSVTTYDDVRVFSLYDVDISPVDNANALTEYERDAFSQEIRLQSTGDRQFNWLVAAYYTEGANPGGGGNTLGGTRFPATVVQPFDHVEFEGYAVFTDLEYALDDYWTIGAGIRYDSIDKSINFVNNPAAVLEDTFTGTQPKFTVGYKLNDDTRIHFAAAKGFREGGFVPTLIGTPLERFPNDELWSYETGVKSTFGEGRGSAEVAVFYIDAGAFNGTALLPTPVGTRLVTVPIGKVESYGLELATSYRITELFTVDFLGGYNQAEPTELVEGVQNGTALVGEQAIEAPLWNFRLAGRLDIPWERNTNIGLQAAFTGVGPTNFLGENLPDAPLTERDPYYLLDVRALFEWENYTLTAFVQNATDTVYAETYRPLSASAAFGGTSRGVIYNDPRYFGVSFKAEF